MNDFAAEPPALREAMLAAVLRVLGSGWYVLGDEGRRFESEWASYCGVRHALGAANGLDAIELMLRALGVGPGDEVITTPMTAFATSLAIVRAGANPVLADIDPHSALLDPASVERCIGRHTRALLLVHLYGQVRQMLRWQKLCDDAGIHLLEDCAQAHGARQAGRTAGAFGIAGAYSFYPTKNLGAVGDAGAVITDSDSIAAKVAQLRNYGQSDRYHHPILGMNSRLDEVQAALLTVRLEWLNEFTQRRREVARLFDAGLRNPSIEPMAAPEQPESHVHHLYVVRCRHRDALLAHLREHAVQALIHYPVPVHHQPPAAAWRADPVGLRNAEGHAATCLSLPCHPQMSGDDVERVIAAVNSFQAP